MAAITATVLSAAATAASAVATAATAVGAGIAAGAGAVVAGVGSAATAVGMGTVGGALTGVGASMGATAAGLTGVAGTVAGVTSAATTGAIVGGISGGGMAAVTGQDIMKGFTRGATIGAATGGLAHVGGMVADSITGLGSASSMAAGPVQVTTAQTWGHFAGTSLGGGAGAMLAGATPGEAISAGLGAGVMMTPGLSAATKLALGVAGTAASSFMATSPGMPAAVATKLNNPQSVPGGRNVQGEDGKIVARKPVTPEQNIGGGASNPGFTPALTSGNVGATLAVDNRRLDRVRSGMDFGAPGLSPAVV